MSFNPDYITLSNYEEFFILYMDNELSAQEKTAVDAFILIHPHLAAELDMLLATKLPPDEVSFRDKEDLLSSSLKLTMTEEELLLYIDNELSVADKALVEEKIATDKDYTRQYSLLLQTRVDAAETISYPDKKELYRHTEKVILMPVWMRVAVAVVLILSASLLFFLTANKPAVIEPSIVTGPLIKQPVKKNFTPEQKDKPIQQLTKETAVVRLPEGKKDAAALSKSSLLKDQQPQQMTDVATNENILTKTKRDVIRFEVRHFTAQPNASDSLNKTIAYTSVTSPAVNPYNNQNDPQNPEAEWAVEKQKTTKARGFFRKVSRFIERRTGIGTVNADNELLVGAVALKLK